MNYKFQAILLWKDICFIIFIRYILSNIILQSISYEKAGDMPNKNLNFNVQN